MGALRRVLGAYAGLVFSTHPAIGALLLLATLVDLHAATSGLFAITIALATFRALGVTSPSLVGPAAVSALLVGLGLAHVFATTVALLAMLAIASIATTLVTAALSSMLARVGLPVLALAFVLVLPLAVAAGITAGLPFAPSLAPPPDALPRALDRGLSAFGAVLFLPRWDVGIVVVIALAVHSRVGFIYAVTGLGAVMSAAELAPLPLDPALVATAGLNAWLTAIALGGVWFVPSFSSLLLAIVGALLAALLSAGLAGVAGRLGLPLLITPFSAASMIILLAMRQRANDARPKAVDFEPGTPEENLRFHRTRRARFGAPNQVTFTLPFRGRWTCTQGVDGEHTHQGPWRHAFDFEVQDHDGAFVREGGARPEDHHCYGLPVLAAAPGTVVAVCADVPDVRTGDVDLERNWGNHVVVAHGHELYSLVAHLAPNTVRVALGQIVTRGEVLGACGASGRAPRPHLHFQLQSRPELGAPTLPCRFADAVETTRDTRDVERLVREVAPREGEMVRGLVADPELARAFEWPIGAKLTFDVEGATEQLEIKVTLLGQRILASCDRPGASLPYDVTPLGFVAYDGTGAESSIVHLLRLALPRVPFDVAEELEFSDVVPSSATSGLAARVLGDLVAPFVPGAVSAGSAGSEMLYRLRRLPHGGVVITGTSIARDRRGQPKLATTLEADASGLRTIEVRRGSRTTCARRITRKPADDTKSPAIERRRATWSKGKA